MEQLLVTQEASRRDGPPRPAEFSFADWVQVAGVIFSALLAIVLASTRAIVVSVILAVAAILICVTLYARFARHTPFRSPLFVALSLLSVISLGSAIAAAVMLNPSAQPGSNAKGNSSAPKNAPVAGASPSAARATSASAQASTPEGTPEPLVQKSGWKLQPSSSVFTNDEDKVDLDTGCPGWGDMHPRVGPSRCGEMADLVLDQDSLHTATDSPNIIVLPSGSVASYSTCHSLLTAGLNGGVNSIQGARLHAGEELCVKTDVGNISVVRVDKVAMDTAGNLTAVTLDFRVWAEQ